MLLECSDAAKSPVSRALTLIDVETARYGGTVGTVCALSYLPLTSLLGTLAARMPLPVDAAQIIETHLGDAAR